MTKNSFRLLLVALALLGSFSVTSAKAEQCSGPDYSYKDGSTQLVCFHCESATYCYPTN
jgi:hypothetical protein